MQTETTPKTEVNAMLEKLGIAAKGAGGPAPASGPTVGDMAGR